MNSRGAVLMPNAIVFVFALRDVVTSQRITEHSPKREEDCRVLRLLDANTKKSCVSITMRTALFLALLATAAHAFAPTFSTVHQVSFIQQKF